MIILTTEYVYYDKIKIANDELSKKIIIMTTKQSEY